MGKVSQCRDLKNRWPVLEGTTATQPQMQDLKCPFCAISSLLTRILIDQEVSNE